MRYALDWCLLDFPKGDNETASDQCTTACGRISNALELNILNATASSTYDYCQDPEFVPNVGSCASCYKEVPNQLYLSNFLNTLEYACQNQPSPVLPFPVKPSDIFTYQPPSNFSNLGATSTSPHGISHDARVAIAISVPVGVFLIFSLLLVYFYVHRNAPSEDPRHGNRNSNRQTNCNEKHVSKSTSGWSKTPPRRGVHSRNHSSNTASHQVSYPAPLKPSKVAVPAPLRTRNSPIPFSRNYYQPTNYGLEQPSQPPPPATSSPEILPATKYSPPHPNTPSSEPQRPQPGPSKSGRAAGTESQRAQHVPAAGKDPRGAPCATRGVRGRGQTTEGGGDPERRGALEPAKALGVQQSDIAGGNAPGTTEPDVERGDARDHDDDDDDEERERRLHGPRGGEQQPPASPTRQPVPSAADRKPRGRGRGRQQHPRRAARRRPRPAPPGQQQHLPAEHAVPPGTAGSAGHGRPAGTAADGGDSGMGGPGERRGSGKLGGGETECES
ncbi:MAG: hypothetical protein Q9161_006902 [Pseudevernia consocians]